ncbi:hypothetical protein H0H87_006906, partial [Tephrocybe sp. NHM501043]
MLFESTFINECRSTKLYIPYSDVQKVTPRPVRSRRKSSRTLAAESEETKPKRRARPSKSKPKCIPIFKMKATVPVSTSIREIFDGVVITAPRSTYMKAKETSTADEGRDEYMAGMEDAEKDVDMGRADDDLILDTVVESSLIKKTNLSMARSQKKMIKKRQSAMPKKTLGLLLP